MAKKLSERKKMCCEYYLECWSKTEAAKMAGYKSKKSENLNTFAYRLFNEPQVKEYLEQRLKEKKESLIIKQDEILAYLSNAIRGNESDKHVVTKRVGSGSGIFNDEIVEKDIPIKQKDRLKAAEIMSKIYKLMDSYTKENQNITIVNNIPTEESEE